MSRLTLRDAGVADLPAANRVVRAALMTWDLPERVKRLSLPSYLYRPEDLDHLTLRLAPQQDNVLGVAAWEAADPSGCPPGQRGLLLHGLYVQPTAMRQGVGARLLQAAAEAAASGGFAGVLVKAQRGAEGYFERRGLRRLATGPASGAFPRRYWLSV